MSKNNSLSSLSLVLLPAFALLAVVAFTKNLPAHYFQMSGFNKQCKPTLRAGGFVRDTLTLAEMSAVSVWTKKVSKYGDDYNFWSNASRKIMRCRKIRGTRMVNCTAWAAPCKNLYDTAGHMQMALKFN
ncbi:MAG: hypothetical protein ACRBBN_04025 [Methyloligellaceae bacterium]